MPSQAGMFLSGGAEARESGVRAVDLAAAGAGELDRRRGRSPSPMIRDSGGGLADGARGIPVVRGIGRRLGTAAPSIDGQREAARASVEARGRGAPAARRYAGRWVRPD
jgi:hypothetical protein